MPTGTSTSSAIALRNVAIIAHVDHGKTTLVDQLLKQSGNFRPEELTKLEGGQHGLIMDSNPIERERGITILSKNCAVNYLGRDGGIYRINIIDTPGHADFGGEVERVLRMADGCLLLVDAFEGPMPQTRFVLGKALEAGLRPVVVVNKCDRTDAEPHRVVDQVFDLLVELGADDHALDFPVAFTSARGGWATLDIDQPAEEVARGTMQPIFDMIVEHIPAPERDIDGPLQMLVTTLDASEYLGRIAIGRVYRGSISAGQQVALLKRGKANEKPAVMKVAKLLRFEGLGRLDATRIEAGDLCAVTGIDGVDIGDTIADPAAPEALRAVAVDEPTISMIFRINDSPFAGQEGDYVTSRQIRSRLEKELEHNVALRVQPGRGTDEFIVAGRGILHLGILLETMRREGFEMSVGKPIVITREIDGVMHEPVETLVIDCPNDLVGGVMQIVGERKGEMVKMEARGTHTSHLVFTISSRALIGLRGRVLTATQGEAIMSHVFKEFVPMSTADLARPAGVLVALNAGQVTGHACELLHDRGVLFVRPGDQVYAGQIVGEHNRDNDLTVNITRAKQLTNFREANKEQTVTLKTARQLSLEQAVEYIEDDELVELTPLSIRLRKKILDESMRKRADRQAKAKV